MSVKKIKVIVVLCMLAVVTLLTVVVFRTLFQALFGGSPIMAGAGKSAERVEEIWVQPTIAPDDESWSDQAYDDREEEAGELTGRDEEELESVPVQQQPEQLQPMDDAELEQGA